MKRVKLLHAAGVPANALHLVPGDGTVGGCCSPIRRVAGVAFTGSTEVARTHQPHACRQGRPDRAADRRDRRHQRHDRRRHRAARAGDRRRHRPPPSARPASAARRCGCSACRTTSPTACWRWSTGAARELQLGDPRDPATQVGPVIDAEAKTGSSAGSPTCMARRALPPGRKRCRPGAPMSRRRSSNSIAPSELREEVFGPVLHVVRWRRDELDRLLDDIAGNGTALTLGIHSRIDARSSASPRGSPHGNVYVNRNMIGAVVGIQPFGGSGLVGHRAEGRRAELSAPLRARAGGDGEHRRLRRQCGAARGRGRLAADPPSKRWSADPD